MKTASILCTGLAFLSLVPAAFAQATLDKAKTQDILKQLTSQPRETWISAGTIEATHQEYGAAKVTDSGVIKAEIEKAVRQYQENPNKKELTEKVQKMALDAIPFNVRHKLANEYTMTSREVVKYDGDRFHWEITVSSRTDSVKPEAALAGNHKTDEFDMAWNQSRIFAWDGQKYVTYAASGGQAIVDAAGRLPRAVNGPLTAGLIPWGHGKFSAESLSAASVSAAETSLNGAKAIQVAITHPDGSTSELVLDPSKAYAVTSATLTAVNGFVVTYTLSGYKLIGGGWVPSSVAVERKNSAIESKAPTSEQWTFTSISTATPSLASFNVPVAMDATIEYFSPVMASSAVYTNSYEVDTDELLTQRLAYGTAARVRPQNCATAALQHVASAFGKSVSSAALTNLPGPNGCTSLYDLKQSAQSLGLYSRVVKTNLAALENLGTTKAILHIPGQNHFVVVDHVDDQYIWLVDLSSRKFYYRQSVHFFPLEWTAGTALLLSDRPITGQFREIPDTALKDIVGGAGWDCNQLIQELDFAPCDQLSGICQGAYVVYWERWDCGPAASGTCESRLELFTQETPCIPDPIQECTVTGVWYYDSFPACR